MRGYRYAAENVAFGHTIHFNADVARLMQDTVLRDLIAHELGRVWHYPVKGALVTKPGATWLERECEADRLATHWGFRMKALREFADAHGPAIAEMTGTRHQSWKIDCSQVVLPKPAWE